MKSVRVWWRKAAGSKDPCQKSDEGNVRIQSSRILPFLALCLLPGCLSQTQTDEGSIGLSTAGKEFVSGTKGVKLILSDAPGGLGSFDEPGVAPSAMSIPTGYPGAGTGFYQPGVSAKPTGYFDLDGTTVIQKPSWITDVQLGITHVPTASGSKCATFGRSSGNFDVDRFYRVSEVDCGPPYGLSADLSSQIFLRVILNRDTAFLGTRENLMMQLEYRATGLRANSDGTNASPEMNLDQLWKVFWGQTLLSSASLTPFSIFIPPNFAHWCRKGSGGYPGGAGDCEGPTAGRSAPAVVKQILIPLASVPKNNVIQLQRVVGRGFTNPNYVTSFCTDTNAVGAGANSPLCLGLVFQSLTLLRM